MNYRREILAFAITLFSKMGSVRRIYYYLKGVVAYVKVLCYRKHISSNELTYRDLWYMSYCNRNEFLKLKECIIQQNVNIIKTKQVCNTGFVVYTTSMWSVDGVYKLMSRNPHYNPVVLVIPFHGGSVQIYENTKDYFIHSGYSVESPSDPAFDINKYDLLIYTNPYIDMNSYLFPVNLSKLVVYVSYSYILSNKTEKLDLPLYLLSWKFFCDSDFYKKLVENKSRVYSNNAIFCGYPKMDSYYHAQKRKNGKVKGRKIVIYAPHQSVNYKGDKAATFDMNGWFLLYLAEKYKEHIFWIVKPHPLLRIHSVEAGIFQNEDCYTDYLRRWEDTDAAEVLENGDYFHLFKESNAMITDSVSFMAEYQFTNNPLLLLESGMQSYNEFGNSIKDILYCCDGNNFIEIENFLINVINNNDGMKEVRSLFFKENLSYYESTGKLANDNMYDLLNTELRTY